MSSYFKTTDAQNVLKNKFVVLIGDSNQRNAYKDLVLFLNEDRFLKESELRAKGELSFLGDELIEGGKKGVLTNGIRYTEVRQYQTKLVLIRFYFVTRLYNTYMISIGKDLAKGPKPDVILMNSCLWDITRYGRDAMKEYKNNMSKTFKLFNNVCPETCLKIWNTTLPISKTARGGVLVPEASFMSNPLRFDILEANYYSKLVAEENGFEVLDLHFHLRQDLDLRAKDGIHWCDIAHRHITNLLLTHISRAWREPLSNQTSNISKLRRIKGCDCPPRRRMSTYRQQALNDYNRDRNYNSTFTNNASSTSRNEKYRFDMENVLTNESTYKQMQYDMSQLMETSRFMMTIYNDNVNFSNNTQNSYFGNYNNQLYGNYNTQLHGNYNTQLHGNYNTQLHGNYYTQLHGNYNTQLHGNYSHQLYGNYNYNQLYGNYNNQLHGNYYKMCGSNYSRNNSRDEVYNSIRNSRRVMSTPYEYSNHQRVERAYSRSHHRPY